MAGENVVYTAVSQKEKEKCGEPDPVDPPKGLGARHTQVALLFLCLAVGYFLRSHLSVAMVAMTTPLEHCRRNRTIDSNAISMRVDNCTNCNDREDFNGTVGHENETLLEFCEEDYDDLGWSVYRSYKWNKKTQEMILYSFFVGYTSMMIPAGLVAQRYGWKIPILVALGANGVLSFITPWLPIFSGWLGVCACRLLQGMTQAAFYPSIHTMLGRWAPISERGRLSTLIYTGSQFGTVVAFQLAGLFCGSSLGWPGAFWVGGLASLFCFGLLAWKGATTPLEYSNISNEELLYIRGVGIADDKKRRTPWRHIITSRPVLGLIATQAGSVLGYLLLLTQIPTYMSKILHTDIKHNGLFSSLPYIAMYFTAVLFGQIADYVHNKKILSVTKIRIIANSLGMVGSGILMVAFTFMTSTVPAVSLLVLAIGLHAGVHLGFQINQIDLAPNFAGPIMALGNMVGNLSSLIGPVMVSYIVGDAVDNPYNWQLLFIITAAFMLITNLIFCICIKTDIQPWNYYGDDDECTNGSVPAEKLNELQEKHGNNKYEIKNETTYQPVLFLLPNNIIKTYN